MESSFSSWKRLNFIEPVTFFILFAFSLSDSAITDSIIYKKCVQIVEQNHTDCSIIYKNSSSDDAKKLQDEIQPHIEMLLILKTSIETLFPTIMCFFLGPWSDTNGRKPLLTYPFLGSVAYYTLFSILSNLNIDPYWYLLPSTISALMGGFPAILLTCFAYTSDVTNNQNRTWRFGFLDFILFGGQLLGFLISPVIFKRFGYCVVFASSAVSCVLGLLYSYFLVKESITTNNEGSLKSVFNYRLIVDLLNSVIKKRNGFDRCLIWCCMIIIALHDDMMQGTATILYLFTKRFGWDISNFNTYMSIHLSYTMIGMILLIKVIAPVLKLPDAVAIIIASLSNGGNALIKAFARKPWHLFLSTGIGIFSLAPASLIRSIISKHVSQQDFGKVTAVTMTMEKLGPFATTPIFVLLQTHYLKTYPCPVWFLPVGLCLIIIILAIVVENRRWKLRNNQLIQSND